MVSIVAPQTPTLSYGLFTFILHGPIAQCLQQADFSPIGQGFVAWNLSKSSTAPSFLALVIICAVDSQIVRSSTLMSSNGFAMVPPNAMVYGDTPVSMSGIDHLRRDQSCIAVIMNPLCTITFYRLKHSYMRNILNHHSIAPQRGIVKPNFNNQCSSKGRTKKRELKLLEKQEVVRQYQKTKPPLPVLSGRNGYNIMQSQRERSIFHC
jgi:hypothetical protein